MRKTVFYVLVFAMAFAPSMAQAAGFRIVEQDNAGQGMAHANVANVSDAASVYYNPAAMTEIGEYNAKAGLQFIDPKGTYDGQGVSLENANETFAIPHVYAVKNFSDYDMAVGLGLFSNFGTGANWSVTGPFRHEATETKLITSTINLNVARKFGDMFSAAVGVNYMKADAKFDSMYPFGAALGAPGLPDGITNITGDGDAWGFNLALLVKPTDAFKVGVSYRSRMKMKVTGDVEILNFPAPLIPLLRAKGFSGDDYKSGAEVEINYPDILAVGIGYQATDKLAVEIDFDYTGWSSIKELDFKFSNPLIAPTGTALLPAQRITKYDWKNVVAIRVGAAYKYNEQTTLRAGFYHDPTPIPEENLTPRLPDVDRKLVSLGVGYKATDNFTIDASYAYLWSDTRTVNNNVGAPFSSVNGDYKTTTNIFGISVGYQFSN